MTDSSNVNMLVNSAYQASVVAGFMLANSWAMKRFLKIKPVNLSQLSRRRRKTNIERNGSYLDSRLSGQTGNHSRKYNQ